MSKARPKLFEFHTYLHADGTPCSARENLKHTSNLNNPCQWLAKRYRVEAGHIADSGTDDECEAFLDKLREISERELALWRFTQ